MSRGKDKAPVIEGAPGWMVTFGDLMSLLLTFFILLFSVSEVKEEKVYDIIRSIRVYWNVDAPSTGFSIEPFEEEVNLLAQMALEYPDRHSGEEGKTDKLVENPFGESVALQKVDDNLRLTIEGRVMFDEGSAELNPAARPVLARIRARLVGYPNRIKIIGHSSPLPLPADSPFRDKYDLAYQRARAVQALLLAGGEEQGAGLRAERIEVASRGAVDLLDDVDLFDPVDRARLRRVEVILTPENAIRQASARN